MEIYITSIMVDDQQKALEFYTEKLGFQKLHDIPMGEHRWLTVTPTEGMSIQVGLEPDSHPAAKTFKEALMNDGIPWTSFKTKDILAECERLKGLGVHFTCEPTDVGPVVMAVFDDTCGNLIQVIEMKG